GGNPQPVAGFPDAARTVEREHRPTARATGAERTAGSARRTHPPARRTGTDPAEAVRAGDAEEDLGRGATARLFGHSAGRRAAPAPAADRQGSPGRYPGASRAG